MGQIQLSIEDENEDSLFIKLIMDQAIFKDGEIIDKGKIAEWDPYTLPVIMTSGIANYGLNGR